MTIEEFSFQMSGLSDHSSGLLSQFLLSFREFHSAWWSIPRKMRYPESTAF
jgi:hypothetical protein